MDYLIPFMKPKLLQGYSDGRHRHEITNTTLHTQNTLLLVIIKCSTIYNALTICSFNHLFSIILFYSYCEMTICFLGIRSLSDTLSPPGQKVEEYGLLIE